MSLHFSGEECGQKPWQGFVSRITAVDACLGLSGDATAAATRLLSHCPDTEEAAVTLSLRLTTRSVLSTSTQTPNSNSWGERYGARERRRDVLIKEAAQCEFHFLERILRSSFFCLHCHQLSARCACFLSAPPSPQYASKLLSPLLFSLAGKIFGAEGMGAFSKLRYQIIFSPPCN